MPQPLNILDDAERAQIQTILNRLQKSRPSERSARLLCHALEDTLNGAMCIDSGSYGLAPSYLQDAGKSVQDVVQRF